MAFSYAEMAANHRMCHSRHAPSNRVFKSKLKLWTILIIKIILALLVHPRKHY